MDSARALNASDMELMSEASFIENFAVFGLLPSALKDLYVVQQRINKVLGFVDEQLASINDPEAAGWLKSVQKELQKIIRGEAELKNSLELQIDQNKAIALTFVFGDAFTEAIEIVEAGGVKFDSPENGVKMAAKTNLFASVSQQKVSKRSGNHRKADRQSVVELQTKSLVQELGFRISDTGHFVAVSDDQQPIDYQTQLKVAKDAYERLHGVVETSEFLVDVVSWFCSCDNYQRCYTRDWKNGERVEPQLKHIGELKAALALLSNVTELPPQLRPKFLTPMPICSHLLAVLIAQSKSECGRKYNPQVQKAANSVQSATLDVPSSSAAPLH